MKEQIKSLVKEKLSEKRIVLFGAGEIAEEFYQNYKDSLNISHCISNIRREWGEKTFLGVLDVKMFNKNEIGDKDYIVVCAPVGFNAIELQLRNEGFCVYENFVESQIASAILQNKKIALFYGRCVLRDIYKCLIQIPSFNEEYAPVWTRAARHQATVSNRILYYTKELCDLYVHTPKFIDHDSIYFLAPEELPEGCRSISVSNLVMFLYWPQINIKLDEYNACYLHPYNAKRDGDFYHSLYRHEDCNINRMIMEGKTTKEIVKCLSDEEYYSEKQVKKNKNFALKLIDIAEKNVDVTIADYLQENYQEIELYQNFSHPNKCVVWEYIRRLLSELGLPVDEVSKVEKEAPEHTHQGGDVPIYPSVAKHMGLKFINEGEKHEIMTGKGIVYMTFAEYVEHYAEYTKKAMDIFRMW